MPAGSVSKARTAAALRPSTSTMSRDGAPRANEINCSAVMAGSLRGRIRVVAVPSEPLRVAGALVVDDDCRIFFQRPAPPRRVFPGCWGIVGGHVEPGETVEEALHREVAEETGWRVSVVLGLVG